MKRLPLITPHPPRLSTLTEALARIEDSAIYSNNGPVLRAFEADATRRLFGGQGACLAVANATLGLMISLRDAVSDGPAGRFALMPAMTFAATAQAAWWAGLTPLVCDVDASDWSAAPEEEERLLERHGAQIAAIVPYATFGYGIDLDRYRWLSKRFGVAVVVDAAASLGTTDASGVGFGAGAPFPIVFSMHATKPFATQEGGLIHCADVDRIERLRAMANFGFTAPRTATLPGLNAKMPEAMALVAQARLDEFARVSRHRDQLAEAYRDAIAGRYVMQPHRAGRQALGFFPLLLPSERTHERDAIIARLDEQGIGAGKYFSPHLGEQPWVRGIAQIEPTPVADMVGSRLLSLPLSDSMTVEDVARVVDTLDRVVAVEPRSAYRAMPPVAKTMIIGGGPAGTALLTAASRHGLLPDLARGLVLVERDGAIGGGQLGRYAITSDSTAQTFLSAIEGNPDPAIAALADHPAALAVARHRASLGVPLAEVGPLLRAIGDRLHASITAHGGTVMTGMESLSARRKDGRWHVRLRDTATHRDTEHVAENLVIATGGHQPLDRLVTQQVAGTSLIELAGDRLLQSDSVLARGGFEMVADLLSGKRAPRVAVIGGSTSALTTVALLLRERPALPFGAGGITLLHRRPLRPFYHSVEAAHAEGFIDFGPEDICPISGFVYRLAGFRLEARELVLRMLGVDGRAPEPRLALHRVTGDHDEAARDILKNADLVIAALGYRPRALLLEDAEGRPLALAAHAGAPMVDNACRVTDASGAPVPGLFGIGLAAGFVPHGKLGGEASFVGQANGLWLWQNDVGMMIVDQLLAGRARVAA
ncbi:DegT/DnrJ/EryC1/StrS family aminotransferase [Sphingomonas mucosissima]|uniref:dTDP-4-amino-4,6-dideoxy-D-glucose transaminase n=1 Tax=Sphingomonas mucosissima TaxID=370959 RepID=A0A245ZM90_9SPHN|nr:DegT/DnrJ/EryC1/StrS family aminotransferase [Sphingomonas mucosissima]OWK30842.1 dTDP-4-amino-4,6-dideoxy-D-glucose transaminase [Sphingomonas mucosissima]